MTSMIHCGTASSPRSRSDANATSVSPNSHSTSEQDQHDDGGDDETQDVGRRTLDRLELGPLDLAIIADSTARDGDRAKR